MTDLKERSGDRSHEVGYEHLTWEEWEPLAGLPREAYDDWLAKDVQTRRDIVGMLQEPETMAELREAADEEAE